MQRVRLFAHLVVLLNNGTGTTAHDRQAIAAGRLRELVGFPKNAAACAAETHVISEEIKAAKRGKILAHPLVNFAYKNAGTEKSLQAHTRIFTCVQNAGLKVRMRSSGCR